MNYGGYGGGFPYGYAPRGPPMGGPGPRGPRPLMPIGPRGQRWGSQFASLRQPHYDDYGGNYGEYGFDEDVGYDEGPPPINQLTPSMVKDWLSMQHPVVIREVMFHSRWLLDKCGFPVDDQQNPNAPTESGQNPGSSQNFADDTVNADMSSWYAPFKKVDGQAKPNPNVPGQQPGKSAKKAKAGKQRPGLGFNQTAMLGSTQMQWTPDGWVPKDNAHKVTSMMRPLPKHEIVPPLSTTYPQASEDRDKLKILQNNVSMMATELNKICKRFNINVDQLDRKDLSMHPPNQQEKLKTAITCVSNAENTLNKFKCFLQKEKYKEWNENQEKSREEKIKSMIGDTPEGVPHKRPKVDEDDDQEDDDPEAELEQDEETAEIPQNVPKSEEEPGEN